MSIYLNIIITCDKFGCTNAVPSRGTLSAQICDGGRVDVDVDPELPAEWVYVRSYNSYRCPEHAGDKVL